MLWVHGFRFYFTPLAGVLFAFPSRYFCSIGRISYLALDRGRPGFRQGFSCPAVLRYRQGVSIISRTGISPSMSGFPNAFPLWPGFLLTPPLSGRRPYNPAIAGGLGSSDFARRYFRNLSCFLFPGYLDGSVPPVSLPHPIYSNADSRLAPAGLPHSAIDGSRDVCSSPSLLAACHGLPRLDTPRHPPQTLVSLDHIILPAQTCLNPSMESHKKPRS